MKKTLALTVFLCALANFTFATGVANKWASAETQVYDGESEVIFTYNGLEGVSARVYEDGAFIGALDTGTSKRRIVADGSHAFEVRPGVYDSVKKETVEDTAYSKTLSASPQKNSLLVKIVIEKSGSNNVVSEFSLTDTVAIQTRPRPEEVSAQTTAGAAVEQSPALLDLEKRLDEERRNRQRVERELADAKKHTSALERDLSTAKNRRKAIQPKGVNYYPGNGFYLGIGSFIYSIDGEEEYDKDDVGFQFKPELGFTAGKHPLKFSLDAFSVIRLKNKYEDEDYGVEYSKKELEIEPRTVVLREGLQHSLEAVDFYFFQDSYLKFLFGNYNSLNFYEKTDGNDFVVTGLAVPEAVLSASLGGACQLSFAFALPFSYLPESDVFYKHKFSLHLPSRWISFDFSLLYNSRDFTRYTYDGYSLGGYYFCAALKTMFSDNNYFYSKYDIHWQKSEGEETGQQVEAGFRLGSDNFGFTLGFAWGTLHPYFPELGNTLSVAVNSGIQIKF